MDWEGFTLEQIVAAIIGAIAVIGGGIWNDNRGYKKINFKIGELNNTNLSRQHDDIKDAITIRTERIEKAMVEKTSSIYTKVDKINEITIRNEGLYQNLDSNQKEIKENVNNFIRDWEKTVSENKELKAQIEIFKSEKLELKIDNEKIKESLNKVILNNEKIMKENTNLKAENKNMKEELNKFSSIADTFALENMELTDKNKKLSEKVSAMENLLDIKKEQDRGHNKNLKDQENEWDREI